MYDGSGSVETLTQVDSSHFASEPQLTKRYVVPSLQYRKSVPQPSLIGTVRIYIGATASAASAIVLPTGYALWSVAYASTAVASERIAPIVAAAFSASVSAARAEIVVAATSAAR